MFWQGIVWVFFSLFLLCDLAFGVKVWLYLLLGYLVILRMGEGLFFSFLDKYFYKNVGINMSDPDCR